MGFREDAIAFKQTLPFIDDLKLSPYDIAQAKDLMQEAVILKNMLDPLEENSPAHRYQEVKAALAKLTAAKLVQGFRHGKIAFTSISRVSPNNTPYMVNAIEELPE